MARIKRETIILVILIGIVFTVFFLIVFNIHKEQNVIKETSVEIQVNESK